MYLAINPKQFNIHNVMLSDKTKNNVMENGSFFRLYYSDNLCNSNGLFIYFTLQNATIEKYFNKIKCSFINTDNVKIISILKSIETDLRSWPRKMRTAIRPIAIPILVDRSNPDTVSAIKSCLKI